MEMTEEEKELFEVGWSTLDFAAKANELCAQERWFDLWQLVDSEAPACYRGHGQEMALVLMLRSEGIH